MEFFASSQITIFGLTLSELVLMPVYVYNIEMGTLIFIYITLLAVARFIIRFGVVVTRFQMQFDL